jgi:hypothetical protein
MFWKSASHLQRTGYNLLPQPERRSRKKLPDALGKPETHRGPTREELQTGGLQG